MALRISTPRWRVILAQDLRPMDHHISICRHHHRSSNNNHNHSSRRPKEHLPHNNNNNSSSSRWHNLRCKEHHLQCPLEVEQEPKAVGHQHHPLGRPPTRTPTHTPTCTHTPSHYHIPRTHPRRPTTGMSAASGSTTSCSGSWRSSGSPVSILWKRILYESISYLLGLG